MFIIKNGKGDLEVTSIEAYEETTSRFEIYELIKEGLDDVASGNTRPFSEAISSIKDKRERRIPFEIAAPVDTTRDDAIAAFGEMRKIAETNGLQDMTLNDINAEIEAVRSGK